eukprot:TRINITY_DN7498_c0_g1_i2.p1 TRINITY_DN7498_c0_g1~~TRINITY_DN7498_c0_g1_i2.p1  ORF type:complete len:387 (-),score=-17.17 TRINITY_DN7498_c0_g1_i2:64-1224(-)
MASDSDVLMVKIGAKCAELEEFCRRHSCVRRPAYESLEATLVALDRINTLLSADEDDDEVSPPSTSKLVPTKQPSLPRPVRHSSSLPSSKSSSITSTPRSPAKILAPLSRLTSSSRSLVQSPSKKEINLFENLQCYSIQHKNPALDDTGRVLLPTSVLRELEKQKAVFPLVFELSVASSPLKTHCSCLDFTADEGAVYVPQWVMTQLHLTEGMPINVKNIQGVPKASLLKLEAKDPSILAGFDPKAFMESLAGCFTVLSVNDCISVKNNNIRTTISVAEVAPASTSVVLLSTETTCEFVQPASIPNRIDDDDEADDGQPTPTGFQPFSGPAYTLTGGPVMAEGSTTPLSDPGKTSRPTTAKHRPATPQLGVPDGFRPFSGQGHRLK